MSLLPDLMDSGVVGSGGAFTGPRAGALTGLSAPPPGIVTSLSVWSFSLSPNELNSTLYSAHTEVVKTLGDDASLVAFSISEVTTTANYTAFFQSMDGSPSGASEGGLSSSRLIGRAELCDRDIKDVVSLFQRVMASNSEGGSDFLTIGMQGGPGPRNVPFKRRGAVNPVWRETYLHLLVNSLSTNTTGKTPYQALKSGAEWAEENTEAVWREWAPDTGAYMNEANPMNSQFKHDFYGTSYDRLVQIKRKYDPTYSMFVWSGVDSDFWEYNMDTGKLCQTS